MIALALVSYAPSTWSLPALPAATSTSVGGSPQVIQLSANGSRIYFADYFNQRLGYASLDAAGAMGPVTYAGLTENALPARPGGLAVCPSGLVAVVHHPTGTVTLFDAGLTPIGSAPSPRATTGAGPLNGIVCLARSGSETVYVNQDLSWTHVIQPDPSDPEAMPVTVKDPNEVTRYAVSSSGITLIDSTATGGLGAGPFANPSAPTRFLAAPRLVASPDGSRLFATNGGSSSVTALAVDTTGALTYVSLGQFLKSARTTGGLAIDASGQTLYAALGEYSSTPGASVNYGIETFAIDPTGALSVMGVYPVGASNSPVDGLRVHPNGQDLVVTAPEGSNTVQIVDRFTLAPVYEPITGLVPTSLGYDASGAIMYVGTAIGQIARVTFPTYSLSVTTSGAGAVDPHAGSYLAGSLLSLSATPAVGYAFAGWSGACGGTATTCPLLMDGDKAVGASFTPVTPTFTFSVAMLAAAGGTNVPGSMVQATVDGTYVLSCINGGTCTTQLAAGKSVTLTASPAAGTRVSGWTGCTVDTSNPNVCRTTTAAAPTAIGATFAATGTGTTVTLGVTGSGTVGGLVPGGTCAGGSTCTATLLPGSIVTLSLKPAPGWAIRSTYNCVLVNSRTGCQFTVPSSGFTVGVNYYLPPPPEE